jgi:hypothetical protein
MSIESQINYSHISIAEIGESLSRFADRECKEIAALYFQLCKQLSQDKELLEIAAKVRYGQPIPNLFLSAVHFLLIKNPQEKLAQYYPTITGKSSNLIPFDLFKSFVLENEDAIVEIIQTKIVQTNVINRCSYLMPIFSEIIHKGNKPTTIIDIGTSAGLTTNWDQYSYMYDGFAQIGTSSVVVKSDPKNVVLPPIYFPISQPITKIGIDQNIIDISDEYETRWLKALVWADHIERFQTMDAALSLLKTSGLKRIEASKVSEFEEIINQVPHDQNLIIYSTFTFYQFTLEMIAEFWEMLDRIGKTRNLHFLSAEGLRSYLEKYNTKDMVVELTSYIDGIKTQKLVCRTNGHGNWIDWK